MSCDVFVVAFASINPTLLTGNVSVFVEFHT